MTLDDENRLLREALHKQQRQYEQLIKDLEHRQAKEQKLKTPEDLIKEMRLYGDPSANQFAHQDKLLWHPKYAPKDQMELLPEDAILGTIKDSKTLVLLQNDNQLLNRFYDMGKRSNGVMELFNSLFYAWWQGMRMTGALGGQERWFQSFETPGIMTGESFSYWEKRALKKKAKQQGLRNRLLGSLTGGGEEGGQIYE